MREIKARMVQRTMEEMRDLEDDGIREEPDWEIDAILCGDGYQHGSKLLKENEWYASALYTGGPESYCQIESALSRFVPFVPVASQQRLFRPEDEAFPRNCVLPVFRGTRNLHGRSEKSTMLETIMAFCRRYPGVAIVIGGPGIRAANPD